jgi:hypothetical protein
MVGTDVPGEGRLAFKRAVLRSGRSRAPRSGGARRPRR